MYINPERKKKKKTERKNRYDCQRQKFNRINSVSENSTNDSINLITDGINIEKRYSEGRHKVKIEGRKNRRDQN